MAGEVHNSKQAASKQVIYILAKMMAENKFKKFLSSRVCIFLLLLAFIWLGLVLVKAFYKKYQLDREISNLKTEIEKLDKKEKELSTLLDYFGSQNYLEKEAKEKLNLRKEGENVVMVPEAALSGQLIQKEAAEKNESETKTENNFIKWWKYFFAR
jgi:cell division protein FtsB